VFGEAKQGGMRVKHQPTFCSFRVNRSLILVLIRHSLTALNTHRPNLTSFTTCTELFK
jgi:hypothetical protein